MTLIDDKTHWVYQSCTCEGAQAALSADIAKHAHDTWYQEALILLQRSGLESPRYIDKRFGSWDDSRNKGQAGQVRRLVEAYVDGVQAKADNWALCWGDYGTGKTHMAIAALRKLCAVNLWPAYVLNWPEAIAQTRESWGNKTAAGFESAIWNRARQSKLLLLDDLDKTTTDQVSIGKLYGVINERYDRRLPTIITMNNSLDDLRRIWGSGAAYLQDTGMAILDRIGGLLLSEIHFAGASQRGV